MVGGVPDAVRGRFDDHGHRLVEDEESHLVAPS